MFSKLSRELDLSSIKSKIENKKVCLKIHESDMTKIYAFCDPELLDMTLKSDKLTFYINPKFYRGKLIRLEEALKILAFHPNANIVGRLAYYAAKVKIIDKRTILWIRDEKSNLKIPHIILMQI